MQVASKPGGNNPFVKEQASIVNRKSADSLYVNRHKQKALDKQTGRKNEKSA